MNREARRIGLFSWCFYDWANSAFPTVITTFVFAAYFSQAVAETPEQGTVLWSRALSVAAVIVAVVSPVLGAVADRAGPRKPWVFSFTILSVVFVASLWFIKPAPEYAFAAVACYVVASVAFQFATVFYDAMLPSIAPAGYIGRLSGWGWALGYTGGVSCLLVALLLVRQSDFLPFTLDSTESEHIRSTSLLVALWFTVFSLPLFIFTRDRDRTALTIGKSIRTGVDQLWVTLRGLPQNQPIFRFLIAHMLYTDGLTTLFAFGGIYAAAEFGMAIQDVLVFGVVLNVTAGIGAAAFAWIDDFIGSKRTIVLALLGLILFACALLLVREAWAFWVAGIGLGTFVGPVQAASRSMMARLSPLEQEAQMYGLYALAGKATAFAGPLLLGLAVQFSGSQRIGMATILIFLIAGLGVLLTIRPAEQASTD